MTTVTYSNDISGHAAMSCACAAKQATLATS